jgi:hypothetical protein
MDAEAGGGIARQAAEVVEGVDEVERHTPEPTARPGAAHPTTRSCGREATKP